MKLKQLIEELIALIEEHPEMLEMPAIYSRDDEGNGFQEVSCTAMPGRFIRDEWIPQKHWDTASKEDRETYYGADFKVNAVCIN
tara:strand:+ start:2482 stop:2733 length:252 start_codon:yes stop_codon:yes gene_type:complete